MADWFENGKQSTITAMSKWTREMLPCYPKSRYVLKINRYSLKISLGKHGIIMACPIQSCKQYYARGLPLFGGSAIPRAG
ncbi:hypothetical protein LOAG_00615 [Loa loa]|uniref:Uncharacterized protein n=1 Tax=Loa loa TaxID=7209 RepID=A0A1S0UAW0_LOALO|nr:hypothetical protein LOAG_00615 [Loa loa]EFO27872.1 hypothetical protein LOAG_00615 [Loa loa]